jgi:hypothetical protein
VLVTPHGCISETVVKLMLPAMLLKSSVSESGVSCLCQYQWKCGRVNYLLARFQPLPSFRHQF